MGNGNSVDRKTHEKAVYEDIYGSQIEDSRAAELIRTDFARSLLHESEDDFFRRIDELSPGANALEIGSGDGRHAIRAALAGGRVYATDISVKSIELSKIKAEQAGVGDSVICQVADAEDLDFEADSFDFVIDHEVFSSIDLERVLPELHRVIKPNGVILAKECFAHNPIFNLNRRVNYLLGTRTKWAITHIFSQSDIELAKKYFNKVEVRYYHLTSVVLAPVRKILPTSLRGGFLKMLSQLDRVLLKIPGIDRLAFKVVCEMSEKKDPVS